MKLSTHAMTFLPFKALAVCSLVLWRSLYILGPLLGLMHPMPINRGLVGLVCCGLTLIATRTWTTCSGRTFPTNKLLRLTGDKFSITPEGLDFTRRCNVIRDIRVDCGLTCTPLSAYFNVLALSYGSIRKPPTHGAPWLGNQPCGSNCAG